MIAHTYVDFCKNCEKRFPVYAIVDYQTLSFWCTRECFVAGQKEEEIKSQSNESAVTAIVRHYPKRRKGLI